MFGIHDFGLFLAAGILLNLTPGPDTAYILGRSIAQGREAGIASALGISVWKYFSHLRCSAWSVRNSGNVRVCVQRHQASWWRVSGFSRNQNATRSPQAIEPAGQLSPTNYNRGISTRRFTNILNPKVALFFLAFLPQFIDPASNAKIMAFVTLGLTFVTTGTIWCLDFGVVRFRFQ